MKEITTTEVTMSSLDFLDNVINPARFDAGEPIHEPRKFLVKVQDELDLDNTGILIRLNSNHTKTLYYNLTLEQMMLVGMRESKLVRRSVISKLKEMEEKKPVVNLPGNYIEALEALIESEKQKAIMAPKADVYDRIVDRNNLYNATQVAQKFGQSAVWMNKQLSELNVYNRTVKRGRAFQQWFIDKGYGIMRETESGHSQPMFYAEGEMWIIEKLTSEGLI